MKKFALSLTIGVGLFIFFGIIFPSKVSAATVYVAGDVGNDSRTKEQAQNTSTPWKTIQQAVDEGEAGDVINVKGGITYSDVEPCMNGRSSVVCIYSESITGTEEAPITFQAWPGTGVPTIDASDAYIGFFIFADFIKIDGFKIINSPETNEESPITGGIVVGSSAGLTITNNVFYNNVLGGIFAFDLINPIIVNNTIVSSMGGIFMSSDSIVVKNNIITDCLTGMYYESSVEVKSMLSGTEETGIDIDYNLLFNNETNYDGVNLGDHDILADPKFVNQSAFNFNLQSSSPAINAGANISEITKDINQIPRPQGAGFDIGAYEYYAYVPSIKLNALSPDPTTSTRPTFSGTATTISGATIRRVYYSIDGGAWSTSGVKASDGSFNSSQEFFSITLPTSLFYGEHTIKVKAEDTNGLMSAVSQDTFVIKSYAITTASTEDTIEDTSTQDEDIDTLSPVSEPEVTNNQTTSSNEEKSNHTNLYVILFLCGGLLVGGFIVFLIYLMQDKSKNLD